MAGHYKAAVAEKPNYDAVRFDNQSLNWTLKEFDKYSSAFAFGLLEAGFKPGDQLVLYVDQASSAETAVTQMGAIKAGVTVVTFDEKDSADALDHALGSGAKGIIYSPATPTGEGTTRDTFLQTLIPELSTMMRGDELKAGKYPHLDMVVQTGHTGIRGVNKFKDVAVYANPAMSVRQIAPNDSDAVTHSVLKNGREVTSMTSGELVEKSEQLWSTHLSQTASDTKPVFMTADLETPFGFASFLACTSNFKKLFIPGSFKMSQIVQSFPKQQSSYLVCDAEFFAVEVPGAKAAEYQEMVGGVKGALVGGSSAGSATSSLFAGAKATTVDRYNL